MYLLNYSVYKPPDSWKSTHKSFLDNSVGCGVRSMSSPHTLQPYLSVDFTNTWSGHLSWTTSAHLQTIRRMSWPTQHQAVAQVFSEESMAFQTKMVANGGIGPATYLPDGGVHHQLDTFHMSDFFCTRALEESTKTILMAAISPSRCQCMLLLMPPPHPAQCVPLMTLNLHVLGAGVNFRPSGISMANARREAEMVLFESVSEALRDVNMHPRQVPLPVHVCPIDGTPATASLRLACGACLQACGPRGLPCMAQFTEQRP